MKKKFNFLLLSIFLLSFIFALTKESNANLYWNQAASFAGSNDSYLSVRDDADLDITGSFTIEAWVHPTNSTSPAFQIILQKRQATASGYTLYLNNGRVTIRTLGTTRLIGKSILPNNTWTHIAGTYNSVNGLFTVFLNGSTDTSVVIAGAAPTANIDSLLIGKGANDPFEGMMDEVRIRNRNLSGTEVRNQYRSTLSVNSGIYENLVYSLTFQNDDNSGNPFHLIDHAFKNGTARNNNVSQVDLSNRPSNTIQTNDCIEFVSGGSGYLATPDDAEFSPTQQLTLSAWIFPRSTTNGIIIHKGPATGGVGTNYRLAIFNGNLNGAINGTFINPGVSTAISENKWSHVTFTYHGVSGQYSFYINGKLVNSGISNQGSITDGTDSLYIGGASSLLKFDGFVDEVSIIGDVKYEEFINDNMFRARNLSNVVTSTDVIYNFDGYATGNSGFGGTSGNLFYFRNDSRFAHNGSILGTVQSPLIGLDDPVFQKGFYIKSSDRRIPETGTSGNMISDTLEMLQNGTVNNIKLFVGLNHTYEADLQITLTNPAGNSVIVFNNINYLSGNQNIITIFNDLADSSLISGRYTGLSPQVKPLNNMISVFGLSGIKGKWILKIQDQLAADTGSLIGWGIQFNNQTEKPKKLNLTAFIQGFYNEGTNQMIRDTMKFYLKNTASPYLIVDSAKTYMSATGFADVNFSNAFAGAPYFLTVKHRNLVETWSSSSVSFDPFTYQLEYDFTKNLSSAYGSNLIPVDLAPVTYACYNGDVNQDQTIDIADLSHIDNDAFNFNSGYLRTDVNGDGFIDIADYAHTDNNASNFVGVIMPPAPPPIEDSNEFSETAPSNIGDPNVGTNNVRIIRNNETENDTKEEEIKLDENYKTGRKISQEEIDRADGK
ncbi:MAG: LamG-like jellyroll fold domain-containing protein [Ignavibacteria bacterium]